MILYRWLIVNSEIAAIIVLPVFRNFSRTPAPFSVVVLEKFRRFLLFTFSFILLTPGFSHIYSKFSMPFVGFFS